MALLGLSQREYDYYVDSLREAATLIGQEAILYQVDVEEKDLYRDPSVTYKDAVRVSIIFEDNPKPILRQNNWLTEDEELPYVAHIVALASNREPIEVRERMKVRVKSRYGVKSDRVFLVSRVAGNHIDPVEWVCKLVPYRERVDMKPETEPYDKVREEGKQDTAFSYLNV